MGMAKRLEQLRRAAGMSERELASAAGLSPELVSQIEQGQETDPRLSTVKALARALGVTLDQLVQDEDEPAAGSARPPAASPAPPPAEELQAQAGTPISPPSHGKGKDAELPPPQSKPHQRRTRRPRGG